MGMKRKPVVRLLVLVFAVLAAFPAATVVMNINRPSLGRVFLANQESSVSLAVRNETASFAFSFDVDPRKAPSLASSLAAFFTLYSEETERDVALEDSAPEGTLLDEGEALPGPEENGEEGELEQGAFPVTGVFDDALRAVVESAWNGGVLRVELALDLPLRVWEVPFAAWTLARIGTSHRAPGESVEPHDASARALKALILRQLQGTSTGAFALAEDVLDASILDVEDVRSDSHHGFVQLDVDLVDALADTFCPEAPASLDACRVFALPRAETRALLGEWLDGVGESFQVQLHFRWQIRGTMLFIANTDEGLQRIVEARRPPPGMLASLPVTEDVPAGRVTLLARQAHLQNNLLALMSGVERHAATLEGVQAGLSEYLASPAGEESIALMEDVFSFLTRWSSEALVESRRSGQAWNARLWYENPDVVRDAEGADALVKEVAAEHFQTFFAPWMGEAQNLAVQWPSEDRVVVDTRLKGVAPQHDELLSQGEKPNPL
jgi:hypothetical protein